MQIVNVGNAGIYLTDEKQSILIDGLYGVNEFFHDRPQLLLKAASGQTRSFRNIENLLFTHRHQDHFDSQLVNMYIKNNQVAHAYVPAPCKPGRAYEDTEPVGTAGNTELFTVGASDEEIFYHPLNDTMWAVFFKTRHMGADIFSVRHYSLALVGNGESYLFMSDADWSCSVRNVQEIIKGTKLKALFVNPLSYIDQAGESWMRRIQPESVIVYHIPYTDRGQTGIRALAEEIARCHHTMPWKLHILEHRLQRLIIN